MSALFLIYNPTSKYIDVIWNHCTQYESNQVDEIQTAAARIVTGATKLASINFLLSETGF